MRMSAAAVVLAGAALLDAGAAAWVWRQRGAVARAGLAALLAATAFWCVCYGLELAVTGRGAREAWGDLQLLGAALIPVAWLAFALEYTGRRERVTRRLLALLAVEPVAITLLVVIPATKPWVREFAPGPAGSAPEIVLGPLFWPHFAWTTGLALVGAGLLVGRMSRVSSLYRRQGATVALAVALPLAANVLSALDLPPADTYDPTPVAVSLSGMVLVWGAFRYRLLDVVPVARSLTFDRLADPVLVVDGLGRVVDRNPAAASILGRHAGIGAPLSTLLHERADVLDATTAGAEIRIERETGTLEFELVSSPVHDAHGATAGRLVHLRDIGARKQAERRLQRLADHDDLTHLPNRRLLVDRLEQSIARARRSGGRCALLVLDLDRFKQINDDLGHAAGDVVLAEIGRRLRQGRRDMDTAARLGGDEFAVLLPEISSAADAELVAGRTLAALARPMTVSGRRLLVTASAGIAVWPDDGAETADLFRRADAASYRAKSHGRNRSATAPGGSGPDERDLRLGADLVRALRGDELTLLYQPLMDLRQGTVAGMEALLRWRHPRFGQLSPGRFLPVAEAVGLAGELDDWVLEHACLQSRRWAAAHRAVPVTVNVSGRRFREAAPRPLSEDVAAVLERTSLPPELLVVDVDEHSVADPELVAGELGRLRDLGVAVALDDFGTGSTSLTHLRRLPIAALKIDGGLVRAAAADVEGRRVLAGVTTLAQLIGLTVVAEGVELDAEAALLHDNGCDQAQGRLYSGPVGATAAGDLLTASR